MVQQLDGSYDALNMVIELVDNMINDALKTIGDRSDTNDDCFKQSRVENLKKDLVESLELNDISLYNLEAQEVKPIMILNSCWTDGGCQSLPTLSEVSVKGSSMSTSSKQGEGDQRPVMKEAATFMSLNVETDQDGFDSSQKVNSNSSLNTNLSSPHEIIQYLQNEINDLSYDSILLSDCESVDAERINSKIFTNTSLKTPSDGAGTEDENDEAEILTDHHLSDQQKQSNQSLESQNTFPQSKKFCQYNNTQYFPCDTMSQDYYKLVDESYERYEALDDEEGQMLLSDSSEELVIIDVEDEEIPSQEYVMKPPSERPSAKPSSIMIPAPQSPRPSTSKNVPHTTDVSLNKVQTTEFQNWEENDEIQVKVIEPTENPDVYDDVGDDVIIESNQYWSNVGLIQEQIIDRKYLGPTDHIGGIENMKGIPLVKERYLMKKCSDELLWMPESRNFEKEPPLAARPQTALESNQVNYLTLKAKQERPKKKFMARVASTFSNMFRSKRKNSS